MDITHKLFLLAVSALDNNITMGRIMNSRVELSTAELPKEFYKSRKYSVGMLVCFA